MNKYLLSAFMAASMLFTVQSVSAETLTKEEANESLKSVIADLNIIKDELEDIRLIAEEGKSSEVSDRNELVNTHQQKVSKIEELASKTYNVNGKEINFLNSTGINQIKMSEIDGDVLSINLFTLLDFSNFELPPTTATDSSTLLHELLLAQKSVNQTTYYYESVSALINVFYEPNIGSGELLDTSDREDLKAMLSKNIKDLDTTMQLLLENYNLALIAANGTSNPDLVKMYNIRYKLNKEFVERIGINGSYEGYNFLRGNKEIDVTINNLQKTIKGPDLTIESLGIFLDLERSYNSYFDNNTLLKAYNESENAFYYVQGYRQELAWYLEKLDPNAVIPEEIPVNLTAKDTNKHEAINSLVAMNEDLQKIVDLLKQNKELAYQSYVTYESINREEISKVYEANKQKINEIANLPTYKGITLLNGTLPKMVVYPTTAHSTDAIEWNLYDYNLDSVDLNYGIDSPTTAKLALGQTDKLIKIIESWMINYSTFINYFNGVGSYGYNYLAEDFKKLITVTDKHYLHSSPSSNSITNSTISPQTVKANKIIRVTNNINWIQIDTYAGLRWIKTDFFLEGEKEVVGTKIETLKRLHLHDKPTEEAVTNATVSPQKLYSPYKIGDWYAVNTWLGVKFVKPDFIEEDFNAFITNTERLPLYDAASNKTKISATVSPQTLKILKRNGEFLLIQTWLGSKYIKPGIDTPNRVVNVQKQLTLTERAYLHKLPDLNHKTSATISPQKVNIKAELSGTNWLMIQTWLGDRWIRLESKYICPDGSNTFDLGEC